MVVSKQLKKEIVIEVLVLLFFVAVILYAFLAINKSNGNSVSSFDGMVLVVDDSKFNSLIRGSDGEGLSSNGVTYTVTNNNKDKVDYKLVVVPDVHDDNVLSKIRVGVDDLYIETLTSLPRSNGGYVLASNALDAGYTKNHVIKLWYMLDTSDEVMNTNINFDYRFIK